MSEGFDIEQVLTKLSLPDKVKLLTGQGWWHTASIPQVGIPSMRISDGANGVRGTQVFNGVPSSCFPCSTGLGSSFDVDLAVRVGKAIGDEARAKSCHILLGPTVNIQRSPLAGRGFESFSEDPHLNGTIAAAFVNGVQSKGVSATMKHYVANDQEFQRFTISSDVSERALREIYLKPFQIAIKNSEPRALMSAYNRVNGTHVCEDKRLLDDILRKEWGFKGMIMSDWAGVCSTTESIKAGLDLEMPGPSVMRGKAVERVLMAGKISISDVEQRVRKVLQLLQHARISGIPFDGPENAIDTPELRQLLRTAAADAIVLLKNDKNLLPLTDIGCTIAVIGPNAKYAMSSGGGSAQLLCTYTVSPLQGITAAAKEIGANVKYAIGANTFKCMPLLDPYIRQATGQPGALLEFWNEPPSDDFTATNPNFNTSLKQQAWSTSTLSTSCFLIDGVDEKKVNAICWLRYSAKFIPDEDGDWEFDLSVIGVGNLFLDRKLIIDISTSPAQGETWYGLGTTTVTTVVTDLKAGQVYDFELRTSNAEFARGTSFVCWGGIRLGGMRQIDGKAGISEAVQLAKDSDIAILVIGLNHDWEGEGFDRPNMDLPGLSNQLVREVLQANPRTVVVNQSGTPVSMPWIDDANTVIQAFYGGNELGNGLGDVLFGNVNPSAKLPLTFPKRLEDSPAYPSFGDKGQDCGRILYNEGIFVGYRSYEIRNLPPLFPFGYGLSYTKFEYSGLEITNISPDGDFKIKFSIENVGCRHGREIAQIYISDQQSSLPRPIKELKGFIKVNLQPGESKKVQISLDREALGFYVDQEMCWVAEKGIFNVHVAASSADLRLQGQVVLKESITWKGL